MVSMRATAVSKYGPIENLVSITASKPFPPYGNDVLVRVKATSVNPVDTKVRQGTYDDYPDFFKYVPSRPHILGFDGAGIVESVGSSVSNVSNIKVGDEVFYSGSPKRSGANAEYQLLDVRSVARKPKSLDFVQAASMPLTWITAWEALVERMEIKTGENAGILIINGAGGVGSVASQIASKILRLPVVITTTSRPETRDFSKSMGATHTVNHHDAIPAQISNLNLSVPLKYVFITHHPMPRYIQVAAKVCAPFGKVCSIVQTQEMNKMYGTEFMSKSLAFIWELLGTKPWYGVDVDSHGKILEQLASFVDDGTVKCHLSQRKKLTVKGLRQAHRLIEEAGVIGKLALGVDEEGEGEPFT